MQALHKFHVKIFAALSEWLLPFHIKLSALLQSASQALVEELKGVLQDAQLENKKNYHIITVTTSSSTSITEKDVKYSLVWKIITTYN